MFLCDSPFKGPEREGGGWRGLGVGVGTLGHLGVRLLVRNSWTPCSTHRPRGRKDLWRPLGGGVLRSLTTTRRGGGRINYGVTNCPAGAHAHPHARAQTPDPPPRPPSPTTDGRVLALGRGSGAGDLLTLRVCLPGSVPRPRAPTPRSAVAPPARTPAGLFPPRRAAPRGIDAVVWPAGPPAGAGCEPACFRAPALPHTPRASN